MDEETKSVSMNLSSSSTKIGRACVICGETMILRNPNDPKQICSECAGRIKNLIYPKGECW